MIFPYRLLQNIEHSPPCCTVGPCWLTVLRKSEFELGSEPKGTLKCYRALPHAEP